MPVKMTRFNTTKNVSKFKAAAQSGAIVSKVPDGGYAVGTTNPSAIDMMQKSIAELEALAKEKKV